MYSTVSVVPVLPFAPTSTVTRGNSFKLLNQHFYHIRKYSFLPRIINTWNSLPDFIVNADSINNLRIDWIFFGLIKILFSIIQLNLPESEIDQSL